MGILQVFLLAAAILAAVFGMCMALIWKWNNYENSSYDERQMADQDRAGKTAFAVLMVYLAVIQILRMLKLPVSMRNIDSLLWMGLLIGIAVYGTIAIWTNAYHVTQKKEKTVILILLGLAAVHLADFIDLGYVYREGTWWYVGTVLCQRGIFVNVDAWVKLVVGLVWLYLALLVLVRRLLNERE